jgi:DNA invertase Pin-like site-specific DNA recombinase
LRAFLYARVSTGEQNEGMQVSEMLERAKRSGYEPEVFTDAISGAKAKRPGLDRMMDLVRRGKCDVVMVYRFDRFARSTQHLVNALNEFNALGVQFISVHEAIDTNTPMGKFAFHIFAAIAEFEREIIRERVKSGVAHARSRGIRLGRPRVDVDREKVALLRAQRLSIRGIADRMGVSRGTVLRCLATGVPKSSK